MFRCVFLVVSTLAMGATSPPHRHFDELCGIGFIRKGKSWHIEYILDGFAAKRDLKRGDQVVSLDHQPFSPELTCNSGVRHVFNVKRLPWQPPRPIEVLTQGRRSLQDATLASEKLFHLNGKKIFYVHIWTAPTKEALWTSRLKHRQDRIDRLIVDLRHFRGDLGDIARAIVTPSILIVDKGFKSGSLANIKNRTKLKIVAESLSADFRVDHTASSSVMFSAGADPLFDAALSLAQAPW